MQQQEQILNKVEVIDFFNQQAAQWDNHMIRYDEVIEQIMDQALISEGKDILDVACGTGVLIPDYLKRNVKSVTAIDISPEMIRIAEGKFLQDNVEFICGDVEKTKFSKQFDCIMVYNAFPHFENQKGLIEYLGGMLKEGGTLSVAHGMSRERINKCHAGIAKKVSLGLISEEELAGYFAPHLEVLVKISDDKMYQVVGRK